MFVLCISVYIVCISITGANEEDIDKAIDNKDMNKLVDYILDGEADKLRDRSSDDEEVQELIDGVPKFEVSWNKIQKFLAMANMYI